jgi:hypothetical protein
MSEPYARAGEWVTCEGGHRIVCFAKTIRVGDPVMEHHLVDWQQKPMRPGTAPDRMRCDLCGERFAGTAEIGPALHFEDGWRSAESGRLERSATWPI